MEIEQVIKISQLYDFYSELLSDKQKQYLDDYYHDQYVKDKLSLKIDINPQMMM